MGPTHRTDADSDSREYIPTADSPFYRFSTPPFRLSFHLCFRVVPVCVSSFPVGSFGERVPRSGLVSEALRVVLRGFVNLPLFVQGQHYAVYLFFTTGGGGSVSLITPSEAPLCSPLPHQHLHSSSSAHLSEHSPRLQLHCEMASASGHTNPRPRGPSLGLCSDCVLPAGVIVFCRPV